MKIAVASGKGGTGKTTVAVSLALSLAGLEPQPDSSLPEPLFLDCDVEAPNAHLFLKPSLTEQKPVGILIPVIDEQRCTFCGKCAEVCQFHAIAVLGKKTLVFPQLCHGCGSCGWICPEGAIQERLEVMGVLEKGRTAEKIAFAHGRLNIGEPMAVPVIRQLKSWAVPAPGQDVILDAPPGTSCPVVETARNADFLLLVTEPTPFGLHDLNLVVQVAAELDIPAGVIINRCGSGVDPADSGYSEMVEDFCREQKLPVLMRIPFERQIGEGIARGMTLIEIHPELRTAFQELRTRIAWLVEIYQPARALEGQP